MVDLDLLFKVRGPIQYFRCWDSCSTANTARIIKLGFQLCFFRAHVLLYGLWTWPAFQGHRGQNRKYLILDLTTNTAMRIKLFLLQYLGHMSCYVVCDLDLLLKVTELNSVRDQIWYFRFWILSRQLIQLRLSNLVSSFNVWFLTPLTTNTARLINFFFAFFASLF